MGLAAGHASDTLRAFYGRRKILAVVLLEGWFVVEEVDVGEAFALEEAEDSFGFGGEVGETGEVQTSARAGGWRGRCEGGAREERAERGAADRGTGGCAEEGASGREILVVVEGVHDEVFSRNAAVVNSQAREPLDSDYQCEL
jgi:hypothetical protein